MIPHDIPRWKCDIGLDGRDERPRIHRAGISSTRLHVAPFFHDPLPTTQAADELWSQVNDGRAWEAKVRSGLQRFDLRADEIPRALSEDGMTYEKGNRRGYFILGSRTQLPEPRYDLRSLS